MNQARSTFPYPEDREVVAHFLAGIRKACQSPVSPLEARAGMLTWAGRTETAASVGPTVAWFNPSDNSLMGKLNAGAHYHPGVLLIHAITDALGAPELRVTRESEPLEIKAGARGPVIGVSKTAERHRFFFAGTSVQIDQPFLITGPMAITAYRAARAATKTQRKNPQR